MSYPLSAEVLLQLARDWGLSQEQQAVFLLRIGEGKSYKKVAAQLNTSASACMKRMGLVYEKFGILGKTRGKDAQLRQKLRQLVQPSYSDKFELLQQRIDRSEQVQDFCDRVEEIRHDSDRYAASDSLVQQALVEWLFKRFIALLAKDLHATAPEERLQRVIDLITQSGYCLGGESGCLLNPS